MTPSARRLLLGLLLTASAVLLPPATRDGIAGDRFASPDGDDTGNDCASSATPCATLARAVAQSGAGDVVKLAGGSYPDGLTVDAPVDAAIEGGWASDFASRDPAAHPTVFRPISAGPFNGGGILTVTTDSTEVVLLSFDGITFSRGGMSSAGVLRAESGDTSNLSIAFTRCAFDHNLGTNATVLFGIASGSSTLALTVQDSTFDRNGGRAHAIAGAIRLLSVSNLTTPTLQASILRSSFRGNRATLGAAILAELGPTSTLDIQDSVFIGNVASAEGGALWLDGRATLANTMMTGNVAREGGGILLRAGELAVTSSTLTKNRAKRVVYPGKGGGLRVHGGGLVTLENSILLGNSAQAGRDLYTGDAPLAGATSLHHCDVGSVAGDGTTSDLGGNLSVAPRLSIRNGIPRLRGSSPLVDAGTCAGVPATDFEGDPRPSGGGCDIGADEFAP